LFVPVKPKRLCNHPGCGIIVSDSYCEEHKKIVDRRRREFFDKRRGGAAARGYDSRWQKVRLFKLAADGLCEVCEKAGRVERATLVHHIKPISEGGDALLYENLMSLCVGCHTDIHKERDYGNKNGERGRYTSV
jgi:5-methylcytosine-specific restriction protein A